MRREYRHMTTDDKMFIIENIETLTLSEMSRRLGFTVGAVQRIVHKMFPDYKRKKLASRWSFEMSQKILTMWSEGHKCKELAEILYVSPNSIPSILRRVSEYYNLPYEPRFRRTK